jgi:hypothetical protein
MKKQEAKDTLRQPKHGEDAGPDFPAIRRRARRGNSGVSHLPTTDPGLRGSGEVSTTVSLGFKELFLKVMRMGGISPAEGLRRGMWLVMAETVRNVRAAYAILREVEAREANE